MSYTCAHTHVRTTCTFVCCACNVCVDGCAQRLFSRNQFLRSSYTALSLPGAVTLKAHKLPTGLGSLAHSPHDGLQVLPDTFGFPFRAPGLYAVDACLFVVVARRPGDA